MPQALHAYDELLTLCSDVSERTSTAYTRKYLFEFGWDLSGNPVPETFPVNLKLNADHKEPWPPQDRHQLNRLLMMCQMAAYFVVALSSGPRAGELLSVQNDCLTESREGVPLLNGRTYKLEALFEGKMREWPMPALGLLAVQTQIELTKLLDRTMVVKRIRRRASTSLWRVFGGGGQGNPLNYQYNEYIREFTDRIGTSHLLDEHSLTNHRFRKTIARLVALAMVSAPKILMDIFGHKDIAMTMHYILTDSSLRAEIMQTQKELLAIRVEKAIANVDLNGGPAANKIKAEVQRIKFIRAREDLQAEDIRELAVRMTSVGREWTIVAPGVLCTKMRDQVGPCALKRSSPNPSKCNSGCHHRLEEADNIGQVDNTLGYIVRNIQAAQAQDDAIQLDALEGQLFTHLKRYDGLHQKWSIHPVVAPILARALQEAADVD
jgi:integrase